MVYRNVVMIDDDQDDREIFLAAIKEVSAEIKCTFYRDGEEAREELKALSVLPDIIFLDLNMPRMEGSEFLQVIKSIDNLKHVPIIIYSTSSYITVSKSKISETMVFLTKPESIKELVNILRKVLIENILKNHITE